MNSLSTLAEMIRDAVINVDDEEVVSIRNNYSGRYMYGRKCIGIVGDESTCKEIIREVLKEAHELAIDNPNFNYGLVVDTLLQYSQDSMGRGVIYYWQNIDPLPEDDDSNDGQPVEI